MAKTICRGLGETLQIMLDELKVECLKYVRLVDQLGSRTLSEDETDELLGELTASVTHLIVHSQTVKEEIEG